MKTSLPQLSIEPKVPTLRSTGLRTLHECRRKFLWSEHYGLRRGVKAQPLRIGTYGHHMLVASFRGQSLPSAFDDMAELLADEKKAILAHAGAGDRLEALFSQMSEDLQKAYAMVCTFLPYYPIPVDVQVLATELFFELRVPRLRTLVQGQIDLVLRNRTTGKITLVDIKTHGIKTTIRAATNVFDAQTHLFYTLGLRALLGACDADDPTLLSPIPEEFSGLSVDDFTSIEYFLLKKPTIKCCKTDDYDLGNYLRRVRRWYDKQTKENPKEAPFAVSFQSIKGSPLRSEEAQRLLHDYDLAAQHDPTDLDWFYKTGNYTQCAGLFGTCAYLDLCRTDRARGQWPVMIDQTYRQEFRT